MWEILTVLVVLGSIGAALLYVRKPSTQAIVVEEYKIEELETEGFRKLIVRFQDGKGRFYRYEFHPAYAHAFSDELVRSAARAMAPKGVSHPAAEV